METLNIEALAVAALNRLVDTAPVIMDGLTKCSGDKRFRGSGYNLQCECRGMKLRTNDT